MRRRVLGLFVAVSTLLPAIAAAQALPDRVILFVGDGVGASYWTAARFASTDMAINQFRVMGLVDTRSSDQPITDSAAGATAYAAGVRTFNGAIGVGPDSAAVPTVLEVARDQGWATGLVATSSVTHATPASFAAHVPSRAMEYEIARHIAGSRVDVLLGGGRDWFDGTSRPDSTDLLEPLAQTHTLISTPEELHALDAGATRTLVGLFAGGHLPPAALRAPSLPDMTRTALQVLNHDPDGFFLMVEASQPDWRGHSNQVIEDVVAEMLDFDAAIREALDFQADNPGTLVMVVADHETGGMAVTSQTDSLGVVTPTASYIGTDHTAQMTPMFVSGPGSERFGGIIDNWRVGEILMELVRR
jgi:alkaline phosphatase